MGTVSFSPHPSPECPSDSSSLWGAGWTWTPAGQPQHPQSLPHSSLPAPLSCFSPAYLNSRTSKGTTECRPHARDGDRTPSVHGRSTAGFQNWTWAGGLHGKAGQEGPRTPLSNGPVGSKRKPPKVKMRLMGFTHGQVQTFFASN